MCQFNRIPMTHLNRSFMLLIIILWVASSYTEKIQIEWDMIIVTVFLSILNQIEFHLVQNRKENCHHDNIPFNSKKME